MRLNRLFLPALIFFATYVPPLSAETLLSDDFNSPDGLVTNEYAFWNKSSPDARRSSRWEMDSGSLFVNGRCGWTGVPDDKAPNAASTNATNSAIFRLNTKRADF